MVVGELTVEAFEEVIRKNLQEEITNLEDRLHIKLSRQFNHIENKIKVVEERLETLESRLEMVERNQETINSIISRIMTMLEKHGRRLDALTARIERLESI